MDFIFLKFCPGFITLIAFSASKSPDLLIWRWSLRRNFDNIRTDSVLSGQKVSLQTFISLIFYLSIKCLTSIAVAQVTLLPSEAQELLSNYIRQSLGNKNTTKSTEDRSSSNPPSSSNPRSTSDPPPNIPSSNNPPPDSLQPDEP